MRVKWENLWVSIWGAPTLLQDTPSAIFKGSLWGRCPREETTRADQSNGGIMAEGAGMMWLPGMQTWLDLDSHLPLLCPSLPLPSARLQDGTQGLPQANQT